MSRRARGRLFRAAGLLAALLVLALVADALAKGSETGARGEALGVVADALAFDRAGADGSGASAGEPDALARLPDGFAAEVLPVEGRSDVRVGADGAVVGYTVPEAPAIAFGDACDALRERGWTAVPSGFATSGSFVKDAGPRTWAYVSCVRAGDATSVVVQCATAERR